MGLSLVIFDMDGLMLDTEQLCLRVWPEVFHMLPAHICDDDCRSACGRNFPDTVAFLQQRHPQLEVEPLLRQVEEQVGQIIEREGVPLKKGLVQLLDALDQKGIPKVVATSTARALAVMKLDRAGITHRFDGLVCGDMVKHSKPDPEIFLLAASRMNVSPGDCMVLEDSFAGITAAHRAGMQAVMVPDLRQPDESVRKLTAACCESLLQVIPLLG